MKTKSVAKKILRLTALGIVLLFSSLVLFIRFSPYEKEKGYPNKVIKNRIIIDRKAADVFSFMCALSENGKWMLYVDHTSTLNKKLNAVDEEGILTRFYCNADETGQQYDAQVIKSIKNKKRVLRLFNFVDFPLDFDEVLNEELFKALPDNKCELSIALFYSKKNPDFWDELNAHVAAYRVKKAIHENLEQLKSVLENEQKLTKF